MTVDPAGLRDPIKRVYTVVVKDQRDISFTPGPDTRSDGWRTRARASPICPAR